MKRTVCLLLFLTLVFGLLPCPVSAADSYGSVPIYIGDPVVDYMAEELLRSLPLEGKTQLEQIRVIYDWVAANFQRYGTPDKTYFDEAALEKQAAAFAETMRQKLQTGEILLRTEKLPGPTYSSYEGGLVMSSDCKEYVVMFAREMMLYRIGTCAHFASLITVLLGHLGLDCRNLEGSFINGDGARIEHKWNCVLLDGQYYWLDCRMDQELSKTTGQYRFFLISDAQEWAKRHEWEPEYASYLFENADVIRKEYEALERSARGGLLCSACSSWAEPYLRRAAELQLYPLSLVDQDAAATVTRAEFAQIMVQLLGQYERGVKLLYHARLIIAAKGYQNPFSDTDAEAALICYELGLANGIGGGKFGPDGELTREQAVTMLGRLKELKDHGETRDGSRLLRSVPAAEPFRDDREIAAWARNYVYYMAACGILNGTGDGSFAPKQAMTREQAFKVAAAMIDAGL